FRETDRNRLLRRARAVLAAADLADLLAHEFAGLGRCRFAFAVVPAGPLDGSFIWHGQISLRSGSLQWSARLRDRVVTAPDISTRVGGHCARERASERDGRAAVPIAAEPAWIRPG